MIRQNLVAVGMLLVAAGRAHGDNSKSEVLVRVFEAGSVAPHHLVLAEDIATQILDSAGVRLRWVNLKSMPGAESRAGACGTSGSPRTIELRFIYSTPASYLPGAMAESLPFANSGIRITVFYDRLAKVVPRRLIWAAQILGHVLAHEIGHMLIRVNSHTETGLMKARWNREDYLTMGVEIMGFTPKDTTFIQANLARGCPPVTDTPVAIPTNY
jgi:hypothetical protein